MSDATGWRREEGSMGRQDQVVIVGAGLAGLVTALEHLLGAERDAFLAFHHRLSTLLRDLDAAQAEGRWTPELARLMAVSLPAFGRDAGVGPRATAWLRMVVEAETAIEWDRIAALDGVAGCGHSCSTATAVRGSAT